MGLGMSKALGMLRRVERSRLCSTSRTVLAKEGEVGGLSAQCLQKSDSAALVSSDVPSSCGGRKRVSKEERHAFVESYVIEYRKMNDWKFPSATDATKHAGGSYYVRKIVQELEYASRLPPLTSRTVISLESEHIDEKKSLTGGRKFRRRVTYDVDRENSSQKVDKHVKRVKEDMKDTSVSSWKLGDRKEKAEYFHGTDFNQLHTKKVEQHEARIDVDAKDDLRKQTDKLGLDGKDGVVKHMIHGRPKITLHCHLQSLKNQPKGKMMRSISEQHPSGIILKHSPMVSLASGDRSDSAKNFCRCKLGLGVILQCSLRFRVLRLRIILSAGKNYLFIHLLPHQHL